MPAYITLDSATKKFTVYSTNYKLSGVYNIRVTATVYGNTTTFDWKLTINYNYDYCSEELIWDTLPTLTSATYTAGGATPLTATFPALTWTPSNCSSTVQYSALLSDGSAQPAYIQFNAATRTFTVSTTDVTANGSFDIVITAQLLDFGGLNTTTLTWNLDVAANYNYCAYYLNWGTAPAISDQTYLANTAALTVSFNDYTLTGTPANCTDTITYTAALTNGTALPAYITLTGKTFQVVSTDYKLSGLFDIRVTACVYGNTTTFDWHLTLNYDYCSEELVWGTPTITAATYTAGSVAPVTRTFTPVTWTPANCSSAVEYTALLSNGAALPSYVTFNDVTRTIEV